MKPVVRVMRPFRTGTLLVVLLAVAYIAWSIAFIRESSIVAVDGKRYFNLFDDAMISMRYAWNLSHGHGLVWNPGERVEGYTNLLLTLIMSIFTGLLDKSSAVLAVQVLGVALVFGCVYLTWKLASFAAAGFDNAVRAVFTGTAVILTITYYPLSFWSLTGMETGLLTILLLASVLSLENYARSGGHTHLFLVAGFLGLAYLTRPDSVIFAAPILLTAIAMVWSEAPATGRRDADGHRVGTILLMLVFYLAFPIGQEVFRIQYYGVYLPNTYYLKLTGISLPDRIRNGLGFISLYLWTHAIFLGIALAGALLKPDRRKTLYMVLVVLPVLYQIWVGGDAWNWWRIMAPAQPLAAILFVLAVFAFLQRLGTPASTRKGVRLLAYLSAISILTSNLGFLPQMFLTQEWPPRNFYYSRVNASVILNAITTPDATVGLVGAGVIPYYTGRKGYDFLGRTDPHIAALPPDLSGDIAWSGMYSVPGHNKYDLTYSIEQLQPTYIETARWGSQDLTAWVNAHYATVEYDGLRIWLRKGAPEVKWNLLPPQPGEASPSP
ncbi:MAG TPA: hypothetical protein VF784_04865 [Anaerolineales bacterium]